MTEKSFNMERFQHSIYLNKPVEEVYSLVGTGSGLTKWFIGEAVYESPEGEKRKFDDYIHKGDEFEWEWLEKDLSITGTVLEAEIESLFKFTFGSLFIVTITVKEDSGRTLFTLMQEYSKDADKNDFAHINCCVCWGFFVTNLKSVMEFGNDLRETLSHSEELVNR
jgi:uncharacterized protein YndB with AHSA1/START domain